MRPAFAPFSLVLCAVLAVVLGGCGPTALVAYRPDDPPTVHLPLAQAQIRDARPAFASLFARELADQPETLQAWLHGPGPADANAPLASLSALDERFDAQRAATSVLIVPGLFSDCIGDQSVPFGDGEVRPESEAVRAAYRHYGDLGLRDLRLVPLPGRVSARQNGALLAAALQDEAARPEVGQIVVVAYSKGVPDLLEALAILAPDGRPPAKLAAVVAVAGVVAGTPLADHYEGLYGAISPHLSPFGCTPAEGGEVESLTRRERLRWLAAHPLPRGIAYYSIVAYATDDETAPLLRTPKGLLAPADPRNDGQIIASDAILPASTLLATARADHLDIALPLDRNPNILVRQLVSGRHYPREALLRATLRWVVAATARAATTPETLPP
ncbi:MAG: hypothetical protein JNM61_03325 [Zoogloeaceae bacterium]|nr:hypothetical protein [Zoogloeaceae bacterium]